MVKWKDAATLKHKEGWFTQTEALFYIMHFTVKCIISCFLKKKEINHQAHFV